ncbi:unnamed protein product [Pylaiella littoralis]
MSTVIVRVIAPGAIAILNVSFLIFFSHPGAITPMGSITPAGVR